MQPFIITPTDTDIARVLDKTWKEIRDALAAGRDCVILGVTDTAVDYKSVVQACVTDTDPVTYEIYEITGDAYITDNENGYPAIEDLG